MREERLLIAPLVLNEDARLQALAEYGLGPDEMQVDVGPILRIISDLFGVPTVLLSLVEQYRQFFAARLGLDVCETGRDVSFCAHALELGDLLVIPDARLDPRFSANSLVTGAPFIRFYAGVPLQAPSGHLIGTLCIIDDKPHSLFSAENRATLRYFATLVTEKLELRRLNNARDESQTRFEQISATSPDGIVCADADGRITFWNDAAQRLFGYCAAEAVGQTIDIIVPPRMRGGHGGGLHRVANGGTPRLVGKSIELPASRKDGSEFPIELSLSMWMESGRTNFGSIIRDISERRSNEDRLYRLAHLDPLTELPNRMVLRRRLEDVVKSALPAALMIVDLDGFKAVNDTIGHSAGDLLLKNVAARLLTCIRPTDTVARLGGDEFAILLPETTDPTVAEAVANRIIAVLSEPLEIANRIVHIGASVGLAMFPCNGDNAEDLLSNADLALYQAKSEGRHCLRIFVPELRHAAVSKQKQELELRHAFEQQEFELFYQPQVRGDGTLIGAEALIRWRHPTRGLLSPAEFLPALENSRLAVLVGDWVIESGCRQAAAWRAEGAPRFRVSVNLFGVQFHTGNLARTVKKALANALLPPEALELEITENIILRNDEAMIKPLRELGELGVGIALDDFGTGYASLSLLKRYPMTRLKVDQSFVRLMCQSSKDASIVRAIITLGKSFELKVTAEGVETEAQRDLLLLEGCEEFQGFLYGRPMSGADFARFYGWRRTKGFVAGA